MATDSLVSFLELNRGNVLVKSLYGQNSTNFINLVAEHYKSLGSIIILDESNSDWSGTDFSIVHEAGLLSKAINEKLIERTKHSSDKPIFVLVSGLESKESNSCFEVDLGYYTFKPVYFLRVFSDTDNVSSAGLFGRIFTLDFVNITSFLSGEYLDISESV